MNNTTRPLSERIAGFALSLELSQIPPEVLEYAKLLLADTFGVAMSCQELDHAKAVRKALGKMGRGEDATLWGTPNKAPLADAVLYNGCLIHGMDYDDTHVASVVHPSASVVATAVTVGEQMGSSGGEMLAAIVAGWEVIVRLGLAAKGRFHDKGFHGTGIVAPFAAACVAARLMGLSEEVLVNALGLCGSQSAALQEFLHDGSWSKKMHPGWGAHSAIYALRLAEAGFAGPLKVLEGGFGLWQTHLDGIDGLEEEFADLGEVWHTPEITFKLYPVCHMTHSFIDCMFSLQKEYGFTHEDIEAVQCRIETRCHHIVCEPRQAKVRPKTDYAMRFSLPYVVAVATVTGRMSPWEIDMKYAEDPEIQALMDKVECVEDPDKRNPGYFPGWLQVTLKDGSRYIQHQPYEQGTPQNPIDPGAVWTKFENNLSLFYHSGEIARIRETILGFEGLHNPAKLLDSLLPADKRTAESR